MPLIYSYLYDNKHTVQFLDMSDPTIKTRNRPVYQRPITVYQGVDNPCVIEFKNQDQKPVNLTGYTFTFDSLTISNLENRKYKITFKSNRESDNQEQPLYFDDNYQAPLDLDIQPAYYNQEPFAANVTYDGGTI